MVWFQSKGQICQLIATLIAVAIAASKAWPDMMTNNYLSSGAILFYCLVAAMIGTFGHWIIVLKKVRGAPANGEMHAVPVDDSSIVKDLRQQVKDWIKKWEDEHGGASARDQIII